MTTSIPRPRLLVVALSALLAGCSSGDGDPGPGAGGGFSESFLLVDTGASSHDTAGARVDALVFERADGSLTDNLLAASREIELARPDAATRSLTVKRAMIRSWAVSAMTPCSVAKTTIRSMAARVTSMCRRESSYSVVTGCCITTR